LLRLQLGEQVVLEVAVEVPKLVYLDAAQGAVEEALARQPEAQLTSAASPVVRVGNSL
jgi:hypothetical protein